MYSRAKKLPITVRLHHGTVMGVFLVPTVYSGTPQCGHFWDMAEVS